MRWELDTSHINMSDIYVRVEVIFIPLMNLFKQVICITRHFSFPNGL